MQINLKNRQQVQYLIDIVDAWLDDMGEASEEVAIDRTHDTVEDLLDAVSGIEEMRASAEDIKTRLKESLGHATIGG